MIRRTDPVISAVIIGLLVSILYAPELVGVFAVAWVTAAVVRR